MDTRIDPLQAAALRSYAAGEQGTRVTIESLELRDYADLIIMLAQNDLAMPRPVVTPAREARVSQARAILQPRLRHEP